MNRRTTAAITLGLQELRRTPTLVVLLLVLPPYFVGAFVLLVPETDVPLSIGGAAVSVSMSAFAATLMTAVSVAIVSGIVGLFLVQASKAADGRLRLAGYSGLELVLARLGTLAAGIVVSSTVAVGIAVVVFDPAQLLAFAAITGVMGLTYGIVGIVVGTLFEKLAGVYVLLLLPLVDVLLFQNPLASDLPEWVTYLPGHFGTAALFDAAFTSSVAVGTAVGAVGYATLLLGATVFVFHATTSVDA